MKMKFNTPIKKAILILLLCTIGLTEQSDKKFEENDPIYTTPLITRSSYHIPSINPRLTFLNSPSQEKYNRYLFKKNKESKISEISRGFNFDSLNEYLTHLEHEDLSALTKEEKIKNISQLVSLSKSLQNFIEHQYSLLVKKKELKTLKSKELDMLKNEKVDNLESLDINQINRLKALINEQQKDFSRYSLYWRSLKQAIQNKKNKKKIKIVKFNDPSKQLIEKENKSSNKNKTRNRITHSNSNDVNNLTRHSRFISNNSGKYEEVDRNPPQSLIRSNNIFENFFNHSKSCRAPLRYIIVKVLRPCFKKENKNLSKKTRNIISSLINFFSHNLKNNKLFVKINSNNTKKALPIKNYPVIKIKNTTKNYPILVLLKKPSLINSKYLNKPRLVYLIKKNPLLVSIKKTRNSISKNYADQLRLYNNKKQELIRNLKIQDRLVLKINDIKEEDKEFYNKKLTNLIKKENILRFYLYKKIKVVQSLLNEFLQIKRNYINKKIRLVKILYALTYRKISEYWEYSQSTKSISENLVNKINQLRLGLKYLTAKWKFLKQVKKRLSIKINVQSKWLDSISKRSKNKKQFKKLYNKKIIEKILVDQNIKDLNKYKTILLKSYISLKKYQKKAIDIKKFINTDNYNKLPEAKKLLYKKLYAGFLQKLKDYTVVTDKINQLIQEKLVKLNNNKTNTTKQTKKTLKETRTKIIKDIKNKLIKKTLNYSNLLETKLYSLLAHMINRSKSLVNLKLNYLLESNKENDLNSEELIKFSLNNIIGYTSDYEKKIVDSLNTEDTKAALFVLTKNINENINAVKNIIMSKNKIKETRKLSQLSVFMIKELTLINKMKNTLLKSKSITQESVQEIDLINKNVIKTLVKAMLLPNDRYKNKFLNIRYRTASNRLSLKEKKRNKLINRRNIIIQAAHSIGRKEDREKLKREVLEIDRELLYLSSSIKDLKKKEKNNKNSIDSADNSNKNGITLAENISQINSLINNLKDLNLAKKAKILQSLKKHRINAIIINNILNKKYNIDKDSRNKMIGLIQLIEKAIKLFKESIDTQIFNNAESTIRTYLLKK